MSEFLAMGGYAEFVWGSYGAALAVFAWNLWAPAAQARALRRRARDARAEDGE